MLYPLHKDSAPFTPTSIMLKSGRYLDLFNPRPEDIELADVAAGLEQPRFKNQTTQPVTIADHLLRCGRFALALDMPLDVVIACLMHDVGEFALGDPPGPIKDHIGFWVAGELLVFEVLEHRHLGAVLRALLIPNMADRVLRICTGDDIEKHEQLKRVDKMALYAEALTWMPGAESWARAVEIPPELWAAMIGPVGTSWMSCAASVVDAGKLDDGYDDVVLDQLRRTILCRW